MGLSRAQLFAPVFALSVCACGGYLVENSDRDDVPDAGRMRKDASVTLSPDVGPNGPLNLSPPTIAGLIREGEILEAEEGEWQGAGSLTHSIQWLRCSTHTCVHIGQGNDRTYRAEGADVGNMIRIKVTATDEAGVSSLESASYGPVALGPLKILSVPTIQGDYALHGTISIPDAGQWSGIAGREYTCERAFVRCDMDGENCSAVSAWSQMGCVYPYEGKLTEDDIGMTIRARIRMSVTGEVSEALTAPTPVIKPSGPACFYLPWLSVSSPVVEGTIVGVVGYYWRHSKGFFIAWQWLRCREDECVQIPNANEESYIARATDVGQTIKVRVTGTDVYGSTSVETAAVSVVAAAPTNSEVPAIEGTPVVGVTLSLSTGVWEGTGTITHTYRWERCRPECDGCVPLAGQNGVSYVVAATDVGYSLRGVVTGYIDGRGREATSACTSEVLP